MQDSEIYETLTGAFHDVFDEPNIVLGPATTSADIEGWDSFNHINLILAIERSFGVKFSTQELEKLESVADIVTLLKKKLA
jgi:acyl carrier protein